TGAAKTLVAYYSYTGNCRSIVTEVMKQLSADVAEIQPAEKGLRYEANNYALGKQLLNAIGEKPDDAASYPQIDPVSVSLADYSTVIIVTPLWWSQMAAIMQSYLFQVGTDLSGKNVGLIVTSASSSISGVVADCKRLVPNANYLSENLWINNSNRSNMPALVANWVETCGLNQTENTTMSINVIVGNKTFTATLADSETGRAFAQLLPMTVTMNELNGNEKYHYLDSQLPTDPYTPGTIRAGDLLLYEATCVVLFYETFSSSYSYTRIGAIDNPSGLAEALGTGNVSVLFEKGEATGLTPVLSSGEGGKFLHEGQVYIRYNGQTYNVQGKQIK
ncbi:MAG: hypothetical protein IJV55_04355, partial [Paludibacteraceae bacterium]|nr:hypothetical protein [Paludibacteraceae bacterium]